MTLPFPRFLLRLLLSSSLVLVSCAPATSSPTVPSSTKTPTAPIIETITPIVAGTTDIAPTIQPGFVAADGSRPLVFPADFGAHPDFRTEWWYYTGNLETADGRHFGFKLTIFRVGLISPTVELPPDSKWSGRDLYFAHFAVSDIASESFHSFQRYSRPGPGLAGAQAAPYHVWLEDWNISENSAGVYQLQAEEDGVALNLTLTDEMGVVLQGQNGYSRKGKSAANASYYYSQPRLHADGFVSLAGVQYAVTGLAWNDHEFSTSVLDENQIGWDWFSMQFEDGRALMLFQVRERGGGISDTSSGTFIAVDGTPQSLHKSDFEIAVLDQWRSSRTQGVYPSSWKIQIREPNCSLNVNPWMADQEINFPPITYWEGAVRFEGTCDGTPVRGNGYVELTGYAGNLPLP